MPDEPQTPDAARLFAFFNEVGIVGQLATTLFEARLPPGFLVSQWGVLNHLTRVGDGRTPLQIARAFQVPKTTMTHTLGVLERHGLIRLAPNPADGRSKCVWLTDAGRSFRAAAVDALLPDLAQIGAGVDAARLDTAIEVLTDLRQRLDRARDA